MTPDVAPSPRFYYVEDLTTPLRRSPAAVRWLIQTKQLASSKLGGRRVVSQAQLDAFFAEAFGNDAA